MTTFSQLVDSLVLEHNRPDLRAAIESYVNLTIRELHTASKSGGSIYYLANLLEDQITADVAEGFTWDIPRPHVFQKLEAVRFDSFGTGKGAYPKERTPSSLQIQSQFDRLFYRSGSTIAFINYGGVDAVISLAWYEMPRILRYYQAAARPATWDVDSQSFTYITGYSGTDDLKLEARELTTNWVLDRWEELVAQGVRTKIYARAGDEIRSKLAYSTFEALRPGMVSAEVYSSLA